MEHEKQEKKKDNEQDQKRRRENGAEIWERKNLTPSYKVSLHCTPRSLLVRWLLQYRTTDRNREEKVLCLKAVSVFNAAFYSWRRIIYSSQAHIITAVLFKLVLWFIQPSNIFKSDSPRKKVFCNYSISNSARGDPIHKIEKGKVSVCCLFLWRITCNCLFRLVSNNIFCGK